MIINNLQYFDKHKKIGSGSNGVVRKVGTNAVKILDVPYFKDELAKAKNIDAKLRVLKQEKVPGYVEVKNLYYYEDYNQKLLWAYKMKYLANNQLKDFKPSKYSLEDKNEILYKILKILRIGHKYGIYNFDLTLSNFYLSKHNEMVGIDVDNLMIGDYLSENYLMEILEFLEKRNDEDPILGENYAFLRLALSLWTKEYKGNMELKDIYCLIFNLNVDPYIKDMMYSILYAESGVNLKELVKSVETNQRFIPLRSKF